MRNQMVIDACNGTHPLTRYGLAMEERTIRMLQKFPTAYLNW